MTRSHASVLIQSYLVFIREHRSLPVSSRGILPPGITGLRRPLYLAIIKSNVRQHFASHVAILNICSKARQDTRSIWTSRRFALRIRQARNVPPFQCCGNDIHQAHSNSRVVRRLSREPLIHFLVLGDILFGVYTYVERKRAARGSQSRLS